MEKSAFETDSTMINTTVITLIIAFYVFSRSAISTTPSLNFIKGKFRFIAGLFLKIALFSSIVYEITMYFLLDKFKINRIELELFKNLQKHYQITYNRFSVDLAFLMLISLKISEIMFISSVFICISLMVPPPETTYFFNLNMSIASFSRLWAIFRIPAIYYSSKLNLIMNEKLALFLQLVFYSFEIGVASLFVLILRFKNSSLKNHHSDTLFFSFSLLAFGFLKYLVNLIDFPFKIDAEMIKFIFSSQFVFLNAIYLQMATIIFPRKNFLPLQKPVENQPEKSLVDVALIETVIEFDENRPIYQLK